MDTKICHGLKLFFSFAAGGDTGDMLTTMTTWEAVYFCGDRCTLVKGTHTQAHTRKHTHASTHIYSVSQFSMSTCMYVDTGKPVYFSQRSKTI